MGSPFSHVSSYKEIWDGILIVKERYWETVCMNEVGVHTVINCINLNNVCMYILNIIIIMVKWISLLLHKSQQRQRQRA